jgi:hypothetical protein
MKKHVTGQMYPVTCFFMVLYTGQMCPVYKVTVILTYNYDVLSVARSGRDEGIIEKPPPRKSKSVIIITT